MPTLYRDREGSDRARIQPLPLARSSRPGSARGNQEHAPLPGRGARSGAVARRRHRRDDGHAHGAEHHVPEAAAALSESRAALASAVRIRRPADSSRRRLRAGAALSAMERRARAGDCRGGAEPRPGCPVRRSPGAAGRQAGHAPPLRPARCCALPRPFPLERQRAYRRRPCHAEPSRMATALRRPE